MRAMQMAHKNVGFFLGSSIAEAPNRFSRKNTSNDAIPRKNVPFRG